MADVELSGEVFFDIHPGIGTATSKNMMGQVNLADLLEGGCQKHSILSGNVNITAFPDSWIAMEIGLMGNVSIDLADQGYVVLPAGEATGSNKFIVTVSPRIMGGTVITFKGEPNRVLFCSLIGVDENGYECDPVGQLARAWILTDYQGNGVIHYTASRNPSDAGKTDRLIVQYSTD